MAESERVFVVTGGGQGIGRAIAETLVARAARVVVFERDAEALATISDRWFGVSVDVAVEAQVEAGMQQVRERFGRLDGLVNNAGISDPNGPPLEALTLEAWRRVIDTNLTGMFLCTKHAV